MELLVSDAPSEERDAVGWLHGLPGGLRRVGANRPGGLERYARILRPGRVGARPATWTEIASCSEHRLDPDSDSKRLMVRDDGACWDEQPDHTAPPTAPPGLAKRDLQCQPPELHLVTVDQRPMNPGQHAAGRCEQLCALRHQLGPARHEVGMQVRLDHEPWLEPRGHQRDRGRGAGHVPDR